MSVFGFSDLAFMGAVGRLDPDAAAYIARVEGASGDNQTLEQGVKDAINAFVLGCKADGIWNTIKASCILAGARTLNGALQPLVGPAPTRLGTEGGWNYNRKTGLQSNGTNNYLNSSRAGNADPQNSYSVAVFVSSIHTIVNPGFYAGHGGGGAGATNLGRGLIAGNVLSEHFTRCRSTVNSASSGEMGSNPPATGLFGASRSTSSEYVARTGQANFTKTATSEAPPSENVFIYARNNGSNSPEFYTNGRLAFYSIGEALDLALLDARVTTLINAFAAAIP